MSDILICGPHTDSGSYIDGNVHPHVGAASSQANSPADFFGRLFLSLEHRARRSRAIRAGPSEKLFFEVISPWAAICGPKAVTTCAQPGWKHAGIVSIAQNDASIRQTTLHSTWLCATMSLEVQHLVPAFLARCRPLTPHREQHTWLWKCFLPLNWDAKLPLCWCGLSSG